MGSRRKFFLPSLHFYNLPLAILLKFFGQVYVFKYKGLCQVFLKSEFFPSVPDFNSVDQWREAKGRAFQNLKNRFKLKESAKLGGKIQNLSFKNEKIYLQHFFKEYEQYVFLQQLARNLGPSSIVLGSSFSAYLKSNYPELIEPGRNWNFVFSYLDSCFLIFEYKLNFIKTAVKFYRPQSDKFELRQFNYVFTGISPVEYPDTDGSLNFAWPVLNKLLRSEDCLFVLDLEPNAKSKKQLDKFKIQYVTRSRLINSLGGFEKLAILFQSSLKEIFIWNFYFNNFRQNNFLSNRIWYSIFKKIKPTHFIFSFSSGWPELHEVSIANALGIKTINWFYGTSEFGYVSQDIEFSDDSVRFSIRECAELWIWNPLLKSLIEKRSFVKSENEIVVVGPLLNGDWRVFQKEIPHRKSFKIAIFDITPMKTRMRLQYGEGPYCNYEMQNRIYESVVEILKKFPQVEILIKTKRAENPLIFDSIPALVKLQELNSDRIQFLPFNSNPYLGIQEADLVISTPFTSPSILALILGKCGLFYDPIGIARGTFQKAFRNLTVYSEEELFKAIEQQIEGKATFKNRYSLEHFPEISIAQMEKNIKGRLE
jgi:polysaccharide biosynthesis PFTS motif protein